MLGKFSRSWSVLLLVVSLGGGTIVEAQGPPSPPNLNGLLRGDYSFSQSRSCVETTEGIDTTNNNFTLNPLPPPGTPGFHFIRRTTAADRGVFRYNGDGTATVTGRSTTNYIIGVPPSASVNEAEFTGNVTYTVNPDRSVDQQAAVTFMAVAGFGQGSTGTVTGIETRRLIVQGGALLHTPVDLPVVETVAVTSPSPFTFTRICVRSGISSE